jgi:Asp-tRNA(Asn)/Glu-tRNA(Gln) amidotransferase B subunit
MNFNPTQVKALGLHMQKRMISGDIKGYELVVALMAMVKDGKITERDVKPVLMTAFFNNAQGVMVALQKANEIIDDDMIDSIISDVNSPSR